MSDNTQAYYEYRAAQARILAAAATNPKISAIHLEMAERYELLGGDGGNDNGIASPFPTAPTEVF